GEMVDPRRSQPRALRRRIFANLAYGRGVSGVEGAVRTDGAGPVRLAIVDDHPVVREAFGNLFELVNGLDVVFSAGDADEALAHLATTPRPLTSSNKLP